MAKILLRSTNRILNVELTRRFRYSLESGVTLLAAILVWMRMCKGVGLVIDISEKQISSMPVNSILGISATEMGGSPSSEYLAADDGLACVPAFMFSDSMIFETIARELAVRNTVVLGDLSSNNGRAVEN